MVGNGVRERREDLFLWGLCDDLHGSESGNCALGSAPSSGGQLYCLPLDVMRGNVTCSWSVKREHI